MVMVNKIHVHVYNHLIFQQQYRLSAMLHKYAVRIMIFPMNYTLGTGVVCLLWRIIYCT